MNDGKYAPHMLPECMWGRCVVLVYGGQTCTGVFLGCGDICAVIFLGCGVSFHNIACVFMGRGVSCSRACLCSGHHFVPAAWAARMPCKLSLCSWRSGKHECCFIDCTCLTITLICFVFQNSWHKYSDNSCFSDCLKSTIYICFSFIVTDQLVVETQLFLMHLPFFSSPNDYVTAACWSLYISRLRCHVILRWPTHALEFGYYFYFIGYFLTRLLL